MELERHERVKRAIEREAEWKLKHGEKEQVETKKQRQRTIEKDSKIDRDVEREKVQRRKLSPGIVRMRQIFEREEEEREGENKREKQSGTSKKHI